MTGPATGTVEVAVIPVAGLGTRMLPASKAMPKEMLPVLDRPMIQVVVDEAIRAGIRHIVFITQASKGAIEDHFDRDLALEAELASKGKDKLLSVVRAITPDEVSFSSVRQGSALGLGHAIGCARAVVGNRSFAVLLPDVLVDCGDTEEDLARMISRHAETGADQIMVAPVAQDAVQNYGTVALEQQVADAADGMRIVGMAEKKPAGEAPSNLAVVGRYVFSPAIFSSLAHAVPGAGDEIQLTDAIAAQLQHVPTHAYVMQGTTYDCGSRLGWIEANIRFALRDPVIGKDVSHLVRALVGDCRED